MKTEILNSKIELIQWLTTLEDENIIRKLIELRKNQTKDWWNDLSKLEKKSINQGIADAEKGKLKAHSVARKIYEKWL